MSVHLLPRHSRHSWAWRAGGRGCAAGGRDWQERGERDTQSGRLARGPCLRGGSSTDRGQSPWPPSAIPDVGDPSSGCKMEAQDLFEHLLHTYLGSAWAGAEPTGDREDRNPG